MNLLQNYIEAIAFGVTELHAKATQDAYITGYWEGYNDGEHDAFDCLDTDQGDEEPFLSHEYEYGSEDLPLVEERSTASDDPYDPFARDVDYDKFLSELPSADEPKLRAGCKVRVAKSVGDSDMVFGREGFVLQFHTDGTALVGFPAEGEVRGSIKRPDNSYTFTWWVHPYALEVIA